MKIFLITESSAKVGFGHLSRCISLYHAFKEKNIDAFFIIDNEEVIKNLIPDVFLNVFNWQENSRKLYDLIEGADVAIIDSYSFNESVAQEISNIIKLPVFIDDNNRINYPRGIVINSSVHAKDTEYPDNPEIYYLLGAEYAMLRKEYWDSPQRLPKKEIETVMITMGINDLRNITPKIINYLNKELPTLKMNVILGKYFQNFEEINEFEIKNCRLIFHPNAEEMRNTMLSSDVAITAGGQTSYELVSLNIPTIIITVADKVISN